MLEKSEKSGFLLIDKPAGWTSFRVVAKLRKITKIKKIGHAGTLDPFATGLLIVAIGKAATRRIEEFVRLDKVYEATLCLGKTTPTHDTEGLVTDNNIAPDKQPSYSLIEETIKNFIGEQKQIPPMHSAKKVAGRKLYLLARAGKSIEREPNTIRIDSIEIMSYAWPELELKISCSSGTYVRTLASDIGAALGVGAYLTGLRRISIGEHSVERASKLDGLEGNWEQNLSDFLLHCQHNRADELLQIKDQTLSRCSFCGLVFFGSFSDQSASTKNYDDYYEEENGARFSWLAETAVKLFRFARAWSIRRRLPQGVRFLDIGSGRGYTLFFLKKYFGWKRTVGTQISQPAFRFSRDKLGLEVYDKDLLDLDLAPETFDGVSMIHVLEHVGKPFLYLKKIHSLVKPGGVFFLEIPNFDSWTRRLTQKYWLSYDPVNHLTFYNPGTIKKYLEEAGFKIESISTFSLEYSVFTSAQSLVSRITRTDHVFFAWLQEKKFVWPLVPHFFLFALITPICLLVNLALSWSGYGEVIRVVAVKKNV